MKSLKSLKFLIWLFALLLISPSALAFHGKNIGTKYLLATAEIQTNQVRIPEVFLSFDVEKDAGYGIIVEKNTQQLFLYTYDGTFNEKLRFNCSTGEVAGDKSCSGDKKTPEGIYFFTRKFNKSDLSPVYGTRAFPIDYPNLFDRIEGRNGYSIWLHGTDKLIKPMDSNGCIVLANNDIDRLAKYIDLNKTPIVIVDKLSFVSADCNKKIKDSILKFVLQWKDALEKGTYHEYLNFYSHEYVPDISWWSDWIGIKKSFHASDLKLSVDLKKNSIFRHNGIYMVLFDQFVSSSGIDLLVGRKKFYISDKKGQFKIVGEEYQSVSKSHSGFKQKHSLVAASYDLKKRFEDKDKIENLIDGWLKAWSAKDITTYSKYYADNFRSQGMNLKSWLKYKKRLNRKYNFINVSKNKLTIKKSRKRADVSFVQTYKSNVFKAVGIKRLILIREKGLWKIYRETWKKL
ncbi:MAG: L,D-transpeptidase [Deltaproteobacteria bacterium]|nr:L,D-transpeptidase [Deltaproteobacteria bacterium]MBW2660475.1 L,D-transpeptidase [Deltaproteobacteria bacterium]